MVFSITPALTNPLPSGRTGDEPAKCPLGSLHEKIGLLKNDRPAGDPWKIIMSFINGLEHIVRQDEPLAGHTWFRLGGPAEYFAEPTTTEELTTLVQRSLEQQMSIRLLGGGSNVLVRDEGVRGLVIRLSAPAFSQISVQGQVITAAGGATLSYLISTAVGHGLTGLEALVGIPGTVGGALHGNSGNHGGDVGQFTTSATVMTRTGEIFQRHQQDLVFSYRESSLNELVILSAQFQMEEDDPSKLAKRMQKLWIAKKARQPMGHQCAGSIFKNTGGMSAGSLIEQAGLKASRVGNAEVSERDANFIIAHSGATSQDVLQLIDQIRTTVSERMGVDLKNEIDIW